MSTYRFEHVSILDSNLTVRLRGAPGEQIAVLYCARTDDFVVHKKEVVMGANGSTVLVLG